MVPPGDRLSLGATLSRMGALVVAGEEGGPPGSPPQPANGDAGRIEATEAVAVRLIRAALDADLPLLCVAWGMQVLNLAAGGKLGRDVAGHGCAEGDGDRVSSYHRIYIAPGGKLAAAVGSGGFVRVNSRHDQGIGEAQKSPLLMASAYSLEDGVIEALESPHHRWVIGVQFHPERRLEIPPHFERLFRSLVERAVEYRSVGAHLPFDAPK